MNRIQLMGRLTRDPEIKYTQTGKAVASFTLAINRYKSEETDFIDCVAWGTLAESVGNTFQKGQLVMINGRLQIRNYETQDGQKRRVAEVVANSIGQPLDSWERKENVASSMGNEVLPDEDIPFN